MVDSVAQNHTAILNIIGKYTGFPYQVSLRKLASKIGMNPGHLSRILSGKRKLCLDSATVIGLSLEMSDSDSEKLLLIAIHAEVDDLLRKIHARILQPDLINKSLSNGIKIRLNLISEILVTALLGARDKQRGEPVAENLIF